MSTTQLDSPAQSLAPAPRADDGWPTLPRWIAPGAVAFFAIWIVLMAGGRSGMLRDPGTFWHTTTGEIILKEGFIRYDPYTFTFAGTWWVPYQWLGEVGMALLHRIGGFDTQLLAAVTILAAVFSWLTVRMLRTGLHPVAVGMVLALGLAAAGTHFHVRPHIVTLGALALTAALLADFDSGKIPLRRLFWLVPLFVFWTNVHGGVLAGIATVVIATTGWVVFWQLGRPSPVQSWRDVGLLALLVVGCGLSTLVNPYGTDMLKVWRVIMGEPALRQIIKEHLPLDPTKPYAWPVFGLAAVYLFVLLGANWREVRVTWLLPCVWFLQTLERCRHASLFVVVTLVAVTVIWPHTRWAVKLARSRPDFYQPDAPAVERKWWATAWLPVIAVLLAFGLEVARVPVPVIGAGWAQHDSQQWPVELLDVIKANEPKPGEPHRLFNDYTDGGFIIYHAPGYKVFVDDRCEVFGGQWLLDFVKAGQENTAAAIARWEAEYGRFDFALTRTDTGFEEYFKHADGWECVKRLRDRRVLQAEVKCKTPAGSRCHKRQHHQLLVLSFVAPAFSRCCLWPCGTGFQPVSFTSHLGNVDVVERVVRFTPSLAVGVRLWQRCNRIPIHGGEDFFHLLHDAGKTRGGHLEVGVRRELFEVCREVISGTAKLRELPLQPTEEVGEVAALKRWFHGPDAVVQRSRNFEHALVRLDLVRVLEKRADHPGVCQDGVQPANRILGCHWNPTPSDRI